MLIWEKNIYFLRNGKEFPLQKGFQESLNEGRRDLKGRTTLSPAWKRVSKEILHFLEAATGKKLFSIKKAVLRNFEIFTGKHLCWGFQACNFIKKRLQHMFFLVIIAKFLRIPIFFEQYLRMIASVKKDHCTKNEVFH